MNTGYALARDEHYLTDHRPVLVLSFLEFVVLPEARLLLQDGQPVQIGSRAFDLLVVLTQHRGQVVPKDRIIRFVWPTTTVDESNLRFQMVLLRKALGSERDLIKTIPGRGYLLVMDGLAPSRQGQIPPDLQDNRSSSTRASLTSPV